LVAAVAVVTIDSMALVVAGGVMVKASVAADAFTVTVS
jgi:hypothetical protein